MSRDLLRLLLAVQVMLLAWAAPPRAPLLTAEELAAFLHLPLQSIWRYARQKDIPVLRAGRLMRFDLARVLEALEQKENESD